MAEGLKLLVQADVSQAEKALKDFVGTAGTSGKAAGSALGKGLNTATPVISKIPKAVKPAIIAVSKLGDSLETLRAKLGARQSFLSTEKDVAKIAVLNREIKALQSEIVRVQSIGSQGVNLGGVGQAATKGFSLLRQAAFVLPGVGVAGILGGAVDAVTSLFTATDKTNEKFKELFVSINSIGAEAGASTAGESAKVQALAAVVLNLNNSYTERNRALTELKGINKNYFGDLTLEAASLSLLKKRVDEYSKALIQQAIIKKFVDKIADVSVAISEQSQVLGAVGADVKKYERAVNEAVKADNELAKAGGETGLGVTAIAGLDKANSKLRDQSEIFNQLVGQSIKLRQALSKAVDTSLTLRPLDDKEVKKGADKTIQIAKQLAAFLDKNTQFAVKFEVDPLDSEATSIKKAREFIDNAKKFIETGVPAFRFKPIVLTDFHFKINPEIFKSITEQSGNLGTRTFKEVERAFKESADKAGLSNELAKRVTEDVNAAIRLFDKQQIEIAAGIGIKLDTGVLTEVQKKSVAAANAINGVLQPAFENLFSAIKAGENPLKAFFDGIGQAVQQLIQKLIAAAIQALILSAIFPGGVGGVKGFGGFFKNILGFASGGLVSGPQLALIGEGVNTSKSNPEVVAPLDQLRSILGQSSGSGQVVVLTTKIRGNNILLMQDRTTRSNNRLGR